jgi:hypothetical protein
MLIFLPILHAEFLCIVLEIEIAIGAFEFSSSIIA